MRQIIVLHALLPRRITQTKRWIVNGKRPDSSYAKELLKKSGADVQDIVETTHPPANEYKGIKIGYLYNGLAIWAKNKLEARKLFVELCRADLMKTTCEKMPVGRFDSDK